MHRECTSLVLVQNTMLSPVQSEVKTMPTRVKVLSAVERNGRRSWSRGEGRRAPLLMPLTLHWLLHCVALNRRLHCIAVNYILWQIIPQSGNVLQHVSGIATYSSAHYTGRTRLDMILVVSIVQWCVVRWHDVTCNTLQFNPCMQGSCAMLVQQEGVALVCNTVWCTGELLHLH